jgi:hypothetical protein
MVCGKKYHKEMKSDPLNLIRGELERIWGEEGDKQKAVVWEIHLRVGAIR